MAELYDTGIFSVNDTDGSVGAGWKLNFYVTGTSTRQDTYPTEADADAATNANANPVVAAADGRFPPIWLLTTGSAYKAVLTSSTDVVKETLDPAVGSIARSLALVSGASRVGFDPGLTNDVARTTEKKLRERVSLLDFIPESLHAGIQDRTGTTTLTTYIQNAIDNVPAGAWLYVPYGTYRMATAVSTTRSVSMIGDPGRENFDNSWNTGAGGSIFDCRGLTGDAFTFQPPNSTNSRVNVILHHLVFRHSRVTAAGTSGSCVYVNGRALSGTAVRLDINDCHFAEGPHHGLFITGEVYGGKIDNIMCHSCGYNGFRGDSSVAGIGEMVLGRIRCFQNGQTAGTEQQNANFLWLGGTLFADMISASESALGAGAIFGGGPINIGHLQLESNDSGDSLIIGQSGSGVTSFKMNTYMISPGTGYTNSHIHITQYMTGRADLGIGFHGDTLGAGGLHFERDVGAGEISWGVTPANFANTMTVDDNASSYNTKFGLYVFARDATGTTDVTGDGTVVTWAPGTEIIDTWAAYSAGTFTAPISGIYEFSPAIPLSGIVAGHDRCTLYFTATTYSRSFRVGSPIDAGNAGGIWAVAKKVTIPMKQGETCLVQFDVTGGTKVIDTVADAAFATLEIRSVG